MYLFRPATTATAFAVKLEQMLDKRFGIDHTTLQVDHSRGDELLTIDRTDT